MGKPDESAFAMVTKYFAYAFQVSVDQLIGVEMVEATRDANQLNIGDERERRSKHHRKVDTHETAAIDLRPSPHVVQQISIIHPPGNNGKLEQLRCIALDV